MATIEQLYATLNERRRPEDVADMIVQLVKDDFTRSEHVTIEKAAKGALARSVHRYTSMLQLFAEAIGAGKQVAKAIEIFKLELTKKADYNKPEEIEAFLKEVSPIIHKTVGQNNFTQDRLNKEQRKANGLDLSKRNYNKKWRLLKRIEVRLQKLLKELRKVEFQKIAKHGLAHTVTWQDFSADLNTACFIAYYNARCNVRSVFTNQSQERPYDDISHMLFLRCTPTTANWWAVAHIYTSQEVLAKITDEQKGILLGRWTGALQDIAQLLDEVWTTNQINRETMIVKRGNDSSTWNNTAGAWNKARDNWMNLIYSMGLDYILDELCFGKVLRLMAGDVAYWHRISGGGLDPNTQVWNKLPLPWEVFQNKAQCNREIVTQLCKDAGLDAEKSGWIAPRLHGIATFTPTPELVHGVVISNPFLATVLKRHKYFSGKNAVIFP